MCGFSINEIGGFFWEGKKGEIRILDQCNSGFVLFKEKPSGKVGVNSVMLMASAILDGSSIITCKC